MWLKCRGAFDQDRTWQRGRTLLISSLVSLGRRTVTGLLYTGGRQFRDWSGYYRLFSKHRFDKHAIFRVIRGAVLEEITTTAPLIVSMDDSLLRKTGTHIPGVGWRRDPLGPPFQINLIRAQRVLQLSAVVPQGQGPTWARTIPIDFTDAPSVPKPGKVAIEQEWEQYRKACKEKNLSRQGLRRIQMLRQELDADEPTNKRKIWITVDGSYTNGNVLKKLPPHTILIGRIRGDAKLFHRPGTEDMPSRGRRPQYGKRAPTPEDLREDKTIPWQTVQAFACGKMHDFKIKTAAPVLWRSAGASTNMRLIVIAPLSYRPRKNSKLLYRRPAYLICTDPDLPLADIIQAYIWRWGVEVNFRDEKQLIGVGQAQVRSAESVDAAPSLLVASYAMLLLAAAKAFRLDGSSNSIPPPKWRRQPKKLRASTSDLINHLRCELWGKALGEPNFSGFRDKDFPCTKPEKRLPDLASSVLYAMQ